MKVFAISDLHLSNSVDKPMNIFGGAWINYWQEIRDDWTARVGDEDIVLLAGDLSWGLKPEEAAADIAAVAALPGKKVIIRGNHDLWWNTYSKVLSMLPPNMYAIQNNCLRFGSLVVGGTRLWSVFDESLTDEDKKINLRERQRLKLTLDAMKLRRQEGDTCILMLHYPPFNVAFDDSEFTELIAQYPIDIAIYGHLHGKHCRVSPCVTKGNLRYLLTSCDQVDNKLVFLTEID